MFGGYKKGQLFAALAIVPIHSTPMLSHDHSPETKIPA
ncbi:hypothetical protein JCM19239_5302 [Vibrio variabilis]|uniref:Uncharacterized protein n=1 Tax=Vibrio variabilis TaxID=990271 RepID=A0ABQ0JNS0_9VIBR|nr:hypothetical protein JCM19239_5302 [Vibrio variabilis]